MSQELSKLELQMSEKEMRRIIRSQFQQIQKELDHKEVRLSRSLNLQSEENEQQRENLFHTRY